MLDQLLLLALNQGGCQAGRTAEPAKSSMVCHFA
jgi:hypothetical protein